MSVYVYLVDLPSKVKAVTTPCDDGFTVYINEHLNREQQDEAYRHELRHISNGDFEKFNISDIERCV